MTFVLPSPSPSSKTSILPSPSPVAKTSTLPGPRPSTSFILPSIVPSSPGEEALGKVSSLPNLLLMIFVPLLALLILVALMVLFCWKVAQHRHKKSDLGDMDLMLKTSMMGDSTLEVGELWGGPRMPPRCGREGQVGCGVAAGLTLLSPWLCRTC